MRTELIVSTYQSPRALTLCLTSVACQDVRPDAICIADDGSGPETADAIAAFAATHPELTVRHVWHEDRGFEKAAMQVTADETTLGDPADSVQFAVLFQDECLVGQYGPSSGGYHGAVRPALGTGGCLIGQTRPIDW